MPDRRRTHFVTALTLGLMLAVMGFFVRTTLTALADDAAPAAAPAAPNPEVERLNNEIKQKKTKIEDLKQQIEARQRDIQSKRGEAASLKNQIGILENRIAKTQLDLEQAETEIDATNLEIRGLDVSISERTREIEKNKAFVAEYLRTINRYDDRGYLEVLLLHDRFSEFFDALQSLEGVEHQLAERVLQLKDRKAELEAQKKTSEEKHASLQALREHLDETRERFEEEQSGKVALVTEVQRSEVDLRRSLTQLRSEQQAIDNDLVTLENSLRKKLADNTRFTAIKGSGSIAWPVPKKGITTYFHDPDYPFRYIFEHPALDLRAGQGTPVRAAASGVVGRARDGGMGYSYVMILHPGGLSTVYGHVSKILVTEDQFVEAGDVIALSGAQPGTPGAGQLTTGPHLHFEVRLNGIPVNPLEYLN